MGCDIHVYIERKTKNGWERVPDHMGPKNNIAHSNQNSWGMGRNYILFGRLASVRRPHVVAISGVKGLPADASEEIYEGYWGDRGYHSASYFSADELLKVKDEPLKIHKRLDLKQYKEYLSSNKSIDFIMNQPIYNFCTDGKLVSNVEMEKIIALYAFWDGIEYFTDIMCENPGVEDDFYHLFGVILPKMLEIEPDPEKIRMVFWFDN
jgi:hypothetical protein